MTDRPSLRSAFERQQQHRFLAPAALAALAADTRAKLDADDPAGLGLAERVFEFDPYEPAVHRALARFHARAGDLDTMRPHVEIEFDLGPYDPAWVTAAFGDVLDPERLATLAAEVDRGSRRRCRTADLSFVWLDPEGVGSFRWADEAQEAMEDAYLELLTHVGRVNARVFDRDSAACIERARWDVDRLTSPFEPDFGALIGSFGHYGRVVATLRAFAAHVDDVRFLLYDQTSRLDEVWIVDGTFHLRRHPVYGFDTERVEHLHWLYVIEGEGDDALRRYLIPEWRGVAGGYISGVERDPLDTLALAGAQRAMHRLLALGDDPLALRARLDLARGQRDAGIRGLRRALVEGPAWREGLLLLAEQLITIRAYREALTYARRALAFGYNDDSALLCCICLEALGDHPAALEALGTYVARGVAHAPGVLLRQADQLAERCLVDAARVVYRALLGLPRYAHAAGAGLARLDARDRLALEVLVPRTGDRPLRLEVARALTERGDLLGELVLTQCHLADAQTVSERARHRDRADTLIADLDVPWAHADLTWDRGFVRSARVPRDAPRIVVWLLGCPAGRLVEELVVGLVPGEEEALIEALRGRPRPSALLRVYVGGVEPRGRWVVRAEPPLGVGLPALDVDVLPWLHIGHAELVASLTFDRDDHRSNFRIEPVEAPREGRYGAELQLLDGAGDAVAALHATWTQWVQSMLSLDDDRTCVTFHQGTDRSYAGLDNLYGALLALAPFVHDTRFVVFEECWPHLDEVTIAAGELRILRGVIDDDDDTIEALVWAAFLFSRSVERPEDDDWRRYVARHHVSFVENPWRAHKESFRAAFERAVELDPENADWFRLRGARALAGGDTVEAEAAFRRQAELGGPPSVRGIVAALAGGRDVSAAEQLARFVVEHPDHTGGRWLAGFLGVTAGAPHVEALLGVVARRVGRSELEPNLNDLEAHDPRFEALVDWLVEALAPTPAPLRPVAAAYLLPIGRQLRTRDAAPEAVDRVYGAAAALDPLGGDVFVEWARMAPARREELLERALTVDPDHRAALSALGRVLSDRGEHARVIEVLGRYRTLFDAAPSRSYGWSLDFGRLADACYHCACVALHGRPAGSDWVDRPGPDALDAADALLDRGLEVLSAYFTGDSPRHGAFYTVKAQVASFRRDDEGALGWVNSALAHPTPHAWSTRASALNNLGRLDEAVDSAERALALAPDHWHSDYVLACVAAKRGEAWSTIEPRLVRVLARWPASRAQLATERDLASVRSRVDALLRAHP